MAFSRASRHFVLLFVVGSLSTTLLGCGEAKITAENAIPVVGKVTRKGKPLAHAQVIFVPPAGMSKALMTQAGPDGKFQFVHVPPGQYQVQLDLMVNGAPDPALEPYRATSPLKAEVTKETTTFEFNADA